MKNRSIIIGHNADFVSSMKWVLKNTFSELKLGMKSHCYAGKSFRDCLLYQQFLPKITENEVLLALNNKHALGFRKRLIVK